MIHCFLTYILFFFSFKDDIESIDNISLDHATHDGEEGEFRWHEKYRIRLFYVDVLNTSKTSCKLKLGTGSDTKIKTISFDSEADLESFMNVCRTVKDKQKERADKLAASFKSSKSSNPNASAKSGTSFNEDDESDSSDIAAPRMSMAAMLAEEEDEEEAPRLSGLKNLRINGLKALKPPKMSVQSVKEKMSVQSMRETTSKMKNMIKRNANIKTYFEEEDGVERISLLIEIGSACNLPAADKRTRKSDPYVRILDGTRVVHKTKAIKKK